MENLDSMSQSDLMAFWSMYNNMPRREAAGKLFGCAPKGYIKAAQDCANFAYHKAEAIRCREGGDVPGARLYEMICTRIYGQLPKYARW